MTTRPYGIEEVERLLREDRERFNFGHTFECWANQMDPGETCICKPWSREP